MNVLSIKKCLVVSILNFKSYYLKTSKGISLLVLPFIMISIFVLQNKIRTNSDDLNLIANALVLVAGFTNISILSNNIACDRHFIRIKLYKASSMNYYIYTLGAILPAVVSTFLSQTLIILISNLFFDFDLFQINIGSLILLSIISSLSLSCLGVYIGFYSKDLVASHTISNLVVSILTFFSGVFFPISNLPFAFLRNFSKIIPLTYLRQTFYYCISNSYDFENYNFNKSLNLDLLILLAFVLCSCGIVFAKNLWLCKNTQ